jgi:hypothetical protein
MKAEDLRIGNYIKYRENVSTIIAISGFRFSFNHQDITLKIGTKTEMHDIRVIKPIILSDKIILNAGFESMFSGAAYHLNGVEIGSNHNGFYILSTGRKIEFVHEFQNLYFVLTGQELIIKNL